MPKGKAKAIGVKFGGFTYGGKRTCRLSVAFSREDFNIVDMEESFVGSRLEVQLSHDVENDDGSQTTFETADGNSMSAITIDSVVDAKGFSVTGENYTTGLTFNASDVDLKKLAKFAGKGGTLTFERIGEASPTDATEPAEAT